MQDSLLGGIPFTVATLDIPYADFIAVNPRQRDLKLRITRPDGSFVDAQASMNLVNGEKAPARLTLSEVTAAEIPAGSEAELIS